MKIPTGLWVTIRRGVRVCRSRTMSLLLLLILSSGPFAQGKGTDQLKQTAWMGIWQSDGYGLLIEVEGDHLQTYQVTTLS